MGDNLKNSYSDFTDVSYYVLTVCFFVLKLK